MRVRGLVRVRRLAYRDRVSAPMLSGDAFASVCEVRVRRPLSQLSAAELRDLRDAHRIFCISDYLEDLLDGHSGLSVRVLLVGNSDRDFLDRPTNLPRHLRLLAMQNSFVSDNELIYTLPIGIENLALGNNGRPKLFKDPDDGERRHEILVGPFGLTHRDREGLCNAYSHTTGPWQVVESRASSGALDSLMREHRWVLSPRGNGVDTHRTWESLYRGAYPVVAESRWSNSLSQYGYPLVIVPSLAPTDVLAAIEYLSEKSSSALQPRLFRWLWMPAWTDWILGRGPSPVNTFNE